MNPHRFHLHPRRFLCPTIRGPWSWYTLVVAAVLGYQLVMGSDLQLWRIEVCYRSCKPEDCEGSRQKGQKKAEQSV